MRIALMFDKMYVGKNHSILKFKITGLRMPTEDWSATKYLRTMFKKEINKQSAVAFIGEEGTSIIGCLRGKHDEVVTFGPSEMIIQQNGRVKKIRYRDIKNCTWNEEDEEATDWCEGRKRHHSYTDSSKADMKSSYLSKVILTTTEGEVFKFDKQVYNQFLWKHLTWLGRKMRRISS